mmetsp:Transcript_10290/g.18818  ORF Transcript_10290/g.18818 Transcript_10290/m.18818 type:complete len:247 (+) Transcript_10290:262-1002(+)
MPRVTVSMICLTIFSFRLSMGPSADSTWLVIFFCNSAAIFSPSFPNAAFNSSAICPPKSFALPASSFLADSTAPSRFLRASSIPAASAACSGSSFFKPSVVLQTISGVTLSSSGTQSILSSTFFTIGAHSSSIDFTEPIFMFFLQYFKKSPPTCLGGIREIPLNASLYILMHSCASAPCGSIATSSARVRSQSLPTPGRSPRRGRLACCSSALWLLHENSGMANAVYKIGHLCLPPLKASGLGSVA